MSNAALCRQRLGIFNRHKHDLRYIRVVAGIIHTFAQEPLNPSIQQWRAIDHVYSQKFYRFPAFDLAILQTNRPYVFTQFVNKINYASLNQDFDGTCLSTAVRPIKSWAINKYVFVEEVKLIRRRLCELRLQRSCHLYLCTSNDPYHWHPNPEIQGSGLVCYETGDPAETVPGQGILVGVTGLVNVGVPNLHTRVGLFHKWITDDGTRPTCVTCILCVFLMFEING